MKKHLGFKAFILLVVIFFHSFVLVPQAHATGWQGVAGRIAFRGIAPSAIAALGSGTGLIIGAVVAGGIGYLIYKSGAVTALKNWLNATVANPIVEPPAGTGNYCQTTNIAGTSKRRATKSGGGSWNLSSGPTGVEVNNGGVSTWAEAAAWLSWTGAGSYQMITPPSTPQDYSTLLAATQPSFPSNSLFGSPMVAAAIAGGAAIVSAITMSDGDIDKFIAGSGSTVIDSDGVQAGNPPSTTDNTVTAGDTASIGLLQQIVNYISNLVGIKTDTAGIKTGIDNVVSGISTMSGKLDNVGVFPQSGLTTLDNIAVNTGAIPAKLDNVIEIIGTVAATSSSVASRIDSLKMAASTKFPFSLAGSLSVATVSGVSTYVFASLPLTTSISIPIEPMLGPLHDLFDWIRQLLVWFFWAGTLLAILRKGMEM